MWKCENVQRTVKDLYDWQQSHGTVGQERYLLSNFTSIVNPTDDFWKNYRDNHLYYDWYFARRYRNFRYYGQDVEGENPTEQVYLDWVDEIYTYLMANDKKYSELYRIELMENTASPMADYHITESRSGTRNLEAEYVSGAREDRSSSTYGPGTNTRIDSTKAFNSSTFVEVDKSVDSSASRTDSGSVNKGAQTDSETRDYTEGQTATITGSKHNPSEALEKYKEVWNGFSFYTMIFEDFCKEFLLV